MKESVLKDALVIPSNFGSSTLRWGEKKFHPRDNRFDKSKSTENFFPKKTPIGKNVDIRKMAEERATKRFKNLKEDNLQPKKSSLGKDKGFTSKREKL